jgi:hypothetical protein
VRHSPRVFIETRDHIVDERRSERARAGRGHSRRQRSAVVVCAWRSGGLVGHVDRVHRVTGHVVHLEVDEAGI